MKELLWSSPITVDYLENQLHKGEVVLAEGDTVLGLLADISEKGYEQLDYIKNREKKPYLLIVGDYKKALNFIEIEPGKLFQFENLMKTCWPGPVTLIFKAKRDSAVQIKSSNGNIALRVPCHSGLLKLLTKFDALFSTSANISGQPVPYNVAQVDHHVLNAVACVVLNDVTEKEGAYLPSTIIDCTGDKLMVVRQGAFEIALLKEFF